MTTKTLKIVKWTGLGIFLIGILLFSGLSFIGSYTLEKSDIDRLDDQTKTQVGQKLKDNITGREYASGYALASDALKIVKAHNKKIAETEEWDKKVYNQSHKDLGVALAKLAIDSPVNENSWLFFFLTFGLCSIGGVMFFLPNLKLLGPPGIKNNYNYGNPSTGRGWIAWITFFYLVGFYILLYFYPDLLVNQIFTTNGLKQLFMGSAEAESSRWFLYGTMYTVVMIVMAIRMYIKYRNSRYQVVRTTSVLFFQIAFAFIIPEFLVRMNQPYMDFKNIWPLDYDFFFQWNIDGMIDAGTFGVFMLGWGIALVVVAVPVFVYFYGKRWYCSWVCGCGGLAETLGDPYRHHSDKTLRAWKIERWLIHGVLVFAVVMTVGAVFAFIKRTEMNEGSPGYWVDNNMLLYVVGGLFAAGLALIFSGIGDFRKLADKYKYAITGIAVVVAGLLGWAVFGGKQQVFFVDSEQLKAQYGFLIGSIFAGVVGTGFYPIFGNRVWCRFGCPLAAYLGFVQRFKSRFRITTNGGQCISCGNCSTYCEQGIDVRWYAQRGQNIIRSSCVGCGICSAVCPRGVLKLENAPEKGRVNDNPILIGNDGAHLAPEVVSDVESKRQPGQID